MFKIALLVPLIALSYYASIASAQRFAPGYCPTVAAHENFDKTKVSYERSAAILGEISLRFTSLSIVTNITHDRMIYSLKIGNI